MPRLLSSYAANKRVEDGLRRKQEQIRMDYIRATHRHLDETEKLVDDLIHINVRTPSAFELTPHANGGFGSDLSISTGTKSVVSFSNNQTVINNSHKNQDGAKDTSEKQSMSTGISPDNFRTDLGAGKAPGHPVIQIRGNEVFYQYEKQRRNWKKVEPSYKTKLLLHRNNTVIKALSHFNSRPEIPPENLPTNDCGGLNLTPARRKSSACSDVFRRESIFSRKGSRRESRSSHIADSRHSVSQVVELPPPLSPGHTPRMLDGWTIMKWCLWNKKQTTPVWATKRYADMKHREYQQFIASKKKSEEKDLVASKPSSANASASQRKEQGRKESVMDDTKLLAPRAKSVPIGRRKSSIIDEEAEHLPSIDRGIIRPTTSILRTNVKDSNTPEGEELRPKTTSRRRVALDTFIEFIDSEVDCNANVNEEKEDVVETISVGRKNSKLFGKSANLNDGKSVSIYAWDTLDETEKESSDEDK